MKLANINWCKIAETLAPLNPYGPIFAPDGAVYGPDGSLLVASTGASETVQGRPRTSILRSGSDSERPAASARPVLA